MPVRSGANEAARWHALLDALDAAALTAALLPRVATVPGYEHSPVPLAEIRRTTLRSFETLLMGLSAGELDTSASIADEIGISRARAGVPLSALLTAVRLDFTVLWEALTAAAGPADAGVIVQNTGTVLRIVDEYVARTQRAYLAEQAQMAEEARLQRRDHLSRLFTGPPPDSAQLRELAAELRLTRTTPLRVSAATTREAVSRLRVHAAELARSGELAHTYELESALVMFTPAPRGAGPTAQRDTATLEALPVGIAEASAGLAQLRATAHLARELAQQLHPTDTGAMTLTRGWAKIAAARLLASDAAVLADVEVALEGTTPAARARLTTAVRAYLATGNVGAAAAELAYHRNTLSKQLRQFTALTGVDPTVPVQAARLVVGWAIPGTVVPATEEAVAGHPGSPSESYP